MERLFGAPVSRLTTISPSSDHSLQTCLISGEQWDELLHQKEKPQYERCHLFPAHKQTNWHYIRIPFAFNNITVTISLSHNLANVVGLMKQAPRTPERLCIHDPRRLGAVFLEANGSFCGEEEGQERKEKIQE
uniref:Oestrogen-type nuclear receptor final C-terminal domain-containing protein n=1 Tax=Cyclophora tenuis TaxID=216820 RepID=A0A7S1GRH1_CYCTE